ncbi:hypothetical protein BGO17_00920 [Candidatus Saccharibacteria bacterium 49-20]|nr:MAG: hypothetical protein BGO17_00920 [Candidatus Saccharibacteria bacterium 49-20]
MQTTNSQTLATYNTKVQTYIDTSPSEVFGPLQVWIDVNLDALSKDARILEIGSGTGKDAKYIVSKGYSMELTDASQGFIDHLRSEGLEARLLNAIEDDLGKNYDMIFADAVFLHFTEPELRLVLRKVHTALNSTGRLAFTLKAGEGEESTTRKMDGPRYFHFWLEDEITQILKETGFSKVTITSDEDFRGEGRPDWLHITALR